MGPSDVEWLNVDRRMAKRNKIKTLISTQMLEAIRIINVTPPQKNKMKYRVVYVVSAVCLLFANPSCCLAKKKVEIRPLVKEEQPVLTFVARQKGKAWSHPFVCVYEPSSDTEPGDIASVNYFEPNEPNNVGIIVKLKNGTEQRIVCLENGEVETK